MPHAFLQGMDLTCSAPTSSQHGPTFLPFQAPQPLSFVRTPESPAGTEGTQAPKGKCTVLLRIPRHPKAREHSEHPGNSPVGLPQTLQDKRPSLKVSTGSSVCSPWHPVLIPTPMFPHWSPFLAFLAPDGRSCLSGVRSSPPTLKTFYLFSMRPFEISKAFHEIFDLENSEETRCT